MCVGVSRHVREINLSVGPSLCLVFIVVDLMHFSFHLVRPSLALFSLEKVTRLLF